MLSILVATVILTTTPPQSVEPPQSVPSCDNPKCCCGPYCPCKEFGTECRCGEIKLDPVPAEAKKPKSDDPFILAQEEPLKDAPTAWANGRRLYVLGAEWCTPCRKLKSDWGNPNRVEYLDIDERPVFARQLWGGVPSTVPCFVLVEDDKILMKWRSTSTTRNPSHKLMLNWKP